MIYYPSMQLAEYFQLNWTELPKELVDMYRDAEYRYETTEDQITLYRELYEGVCDEGVRLERAIRDNINAYLDGDFNNVEGFIDSLLYVLNKVDWE